MASPTPSQRNAQDFRTFVPTLQKDVYPAIDPASNKLPHPFTAVILGGSGAVGRSLALAYARAGATGIVLAARRLALIEAVAEEVTSTINADIKTLVMQCDISSAADIEAVANATRAQFGGTTVGAVIVNAGYSGTFDNDIVDEKIEDYQTAFGVNTLGTAYAGHYFIPMLNQSAHKTRVFIGVCSMSAATVNGPIAHIHYCASKFAQTRVVEMISEQHAKKNGLFAACIHPGGIKSDFAKNVPEQYQAMLEDSPDLSASFCVWLTKNQDRVKGLSGRFLSSKWDVDELVGKIDEIVEKDLLKPRFAL